MALQKIESKTRLVYISTCVFVLFCSIGAKATITYSSSDLALKDYEDMQKIIYKIQKQKIETEDPADSRRFKLEQALQVVMSRKDSDGSRARLYRSLRADLADDESDVVASVVDQAIDGIKDSQLSLKHRSTHVQILWNVISELRPQAQNFKETLEKIRDAQIEFDPTLSKTLALNGEKIISPSALAEQVVGKKK